MLYKQKSFDFVAWSVGNNSIVDLTRLFAGKWMALGSQSSNPLQPLTVSFCHHEAEAGLRPATPRLGRTGFSLGFSQCLASRLRCSPRIGPKMWFTGGPNFLSLSGDLGIGLVWDNNRTPPHPTATFRSDCWNPFQSELNYLWGVLSCSQDDIRWF